MNTITNVSSDIQIPCSDENKEVKVCKHNIPQTGGDISA